jgi:hypothetical protein
MFWKNSKNEGPDPNVNWESPNTRISGDLNVLAASAAVGKAESSNNEAKI